MAKGTLAIHSENILPIIKKWLYSDHDIFLRELISNSCDAISKLKLLQAKEIAPKLNENETFKISIKIDEEKKTISIIDNGIGMTAEEVEKYIAQIAFSGAEDFVEKYQSDSNSKDQIIGHFGLGFYSAYMVASKVDIRTKSYKENEKAVFWSCDGSSSYLIDEGTKETVGTEITLHISDDQEDFLKNQVVKNILKKYCPYLPYPIHLNDEHINNKDPLWIKSPSECTDKEYLDFYAELYPLDPPPLFWVHLNVDYPFHLKGILFFPKIHSQMDFQKSQIKLFCNRVFVSDQCKEILPDYLSILRGAIDSPDIPLNVSRSTLQLDKTVRQLGKHISKKVADRLGTHHKKDKEKFIEAWKDIEAIVKLGVLQDNKFYERTKEFLLWKTTEGEWTTVEEYLSSVEVKETSEKKKIFYTNEEHTPFLQLYKDKGIKVLIANTHLDSAVISSLEQKLENTSFQRVDGGVDDSICDPTKEKSLLDEDGKSEAAHIAEFFRSHLKDEEIEVEAKSLSSTEVPGFLLMKEEERRMRDYLQMTTEQSLPVFAKKTLVLNTNNPLVLQAKIVGEKDPILGKDLATQIYRLMQLSQKELPSEGLSEYVSLTGKLLEKLLTQSVETK